jgi:hypothetical protein
MLAWQLPATFDSRHSAEACLGACEGCGLAMPRHACWRQRTHHITHSRTAAVIWQARHSVERPPLPGPVREAVLPGHVCVL